MVCNYENQSEESLFQLKILYTISAGSGIRRRICWSVKTFASSFTLKILLKLLQYRLPAICQTRPNNLLFSWCELAPKCLEYVLKTERQVQTPTDIDNILFHASQLITVSPVAVELVSRIPVKISDSKCLKDQEPSQEPSQSTRFDDV